MEQPLNLIHPTAQVSPLAKIGNGNYIGPYCIVGPNVTIGNFNRLEAYISVGTPAEHRSAFDGSIDEGVRIGDECVFREFVTINSGIERCTTVGNRVIMLRGSHLGHDVIIKDKANLSCNVMIGGHCEIGEGANLGLGCVVHQWLHVGAYSMVGMGSVVTQEVLPFMLGYGNPFRHAKLNDIGLKRRGMTEEEINELSDYAKYAKNTKNSDALKHSAISFGDKASQLLKPFIYVNT